MKLWREKQTWVSSKAKSKLERLSFDNIKSIAVIKHAAFGDLLCTRPLLVTLRKYFPDAKITFCAISHYTNGVPEDLVDHVFLAPGKNKPLSIWSRFKAYQELGEHDLLLDVTASTPSFILSLLNKAKFKIGFQHRNVHKFVYDVAIPRAQFKFEAETFLEQLHVLGIQYELPLDYAMPVNALSRERPYLVYFPTASKPEKSWPSDSFTHLINRTATDYPDMEHIILAGINEWETEYARNIYDTLANHNNVTFFTGGSESAALIKGAAALVANDTGIRHLGIATNTTTIGIFFDTQPFGYWPRFGGHQIVYEIDGSFPPVEKVIQAIRKVINK